APFMRVRRGERCRRMRDKGESLAGCVCGLDHQWTDGRRVQPWPACACRRELLDYLGPRAPRQSWLAALILAARPHGTCELDPVGFLIRLSGSTVRLQRLQLAAQTLSRFHPYPQAVRRVSSTTQLRR